MTEEEGISYPYLMKRAVKISIEFVIIMILLFYSPEIINLIRVLYGF
ncbi:MAG: hypothetical protein HWN80_13835 [Candidatus Lokiarchaeota archaeon]|nr:hypothetical protein [Candidatus Lokiarchaeota archaeon]